MLTELVQRRRDRRDYYRAAAETIDPWRYSVDAIDRATAKAFVERHHYAGTYPAGRRAFGLSELGAGLVGVAVFGHPSNDKALTNVFPGEAAESVELSRFVLLDRVPGNGETYFLGRCFDQLRGEGFAGVMSMSDPVERRTADGSVLFGGHIGTIYQAHNALFTGKATARTLRLFEDGTVFSDRAAQKIRAGERGWNYAAGQLVSRGAEAPPEGDRRAWLQHWTAKLTRPLSHPGNYRYAWGLNKTVRRHVEKLFPPRQYSYPKVRVPSDAQIALF